MTLWHAETAAATAAALARNRSGHGCCACAETVAAAAAALTIDVAMPGRTGPQLVCLQNVAVIMKSGLLIRESGVQGMGRLKLGVRCAVTVEARAAGLLEEVFQDI